MVKYCHFYPERRCYRSSCSTFDSASGSVGVCGLHPNPDGFLLRRKVGHSRVSIFARRGRGDV